MSELLRCPTELNEIQELQQQAALHLHYEGFHDASTIIEKLRGPFEDIENTGVNRYAARPEQAAYNVARNLRNTLFRAVGARVMSPVIPVINQMLDGHQPQEAPELVDTSLQYYNGDRGRTYSGGEAILAPIINDTIATVQSKSLAALPGNEYFALQKIFRATTQNLKEVTADLLTSLHSDKWRDPSVRKAPFESHFPHGTQRLISISEHISGDVEVALEGTARSSAEFTSSSIADMHTALQESNCPASLWHKELTRHIGLLAVGAMLKDRTADRMFLRNRDSPNRVNPYQAQFNNGEWDMVLTRELAQMHVQKGKSSNCQGAIALPPRTEKDAVHLQEYEERLATIIGHEPKAEFATRGLDTASISTGLAVAATQFYGLTLARERTI